MFSVMRQEAEGRRQDTRYREAAHEILKSKDNVIDERTSCNTNGQDCR